MIKYAFVFLAINICSCSLGAHLPHNSLNILLNNLSSSCKNLFLSQQINEQIKDCNILVPPYGAKQLHCLMFYDINKQLCTSPTIEVIIGPAIINILKQDQDVLQLCNKMKDWQFSNITMYPEYINKMSMISQDSVSCGRLCLEEDFENHNSNFFCKYYKWGSDILRLKDRLATRPHEASEVRNIENGQNNLTSIHSTGKSSVQGVKVTNILSPEDNISQTAQELTAPTSKENSMTLDKIGHTSQEVASTNQVGITGSNPTLEQTGLDVDKESQVTNTSTNNILLANPNKILGVLDKPSTSDKNKTELEQSLLGTDKLSQSSKNTDVKISTPDLRKLSIIGHELSSNKNEDISVNPETITGTGKKQTENSKLEDDLQTQKEFTHKSADEQFQPQKKDDSDQKLITHDEGSKKTNLELPPAAAAAIESPNQLDYGEDVDTGENDDGLENDPVEMKWDDKQQLKNTDKKGEVPLSPIDTDNSQKEFSIQNQEDFPVEEDHFFPFFLTAIVLVVILYVFYHNKSRVLGLLVEGRQSGRRRHSRGHAYRRLDTLEQAMSGAAATPPSKIIY